MKSTLVVTQVLLACLLAAAWIKAVKSWQWKLALLAQEFGHWFALLALLAGIAAWYTFTGWKQLALSLSGIALAAALLLPAVLAARMVEGFQWSRLWLPWTGQHGEISVERRVFWQAGDELLDLIVYRKQSLETALRPWVLVVHSGGWDRGTADEFPAWHRELAAHGIVVLSMNYRLAPRHPWPAQRDDVQHAVAWAREHASELGIDPAQFFLMGRSAGGQIASASAYALPELKAKGVILFYSPMDMVFARRYSFSDDILKLLRQFLGGDPEQAPENYRTASAVNYIGPATPPTLMLHGERDSLVWVEQSRRLTQRLNAAKVRCTYYELPWATHACDHFPHTPGGQLSMQAVLRFIGE